MLYYYYLHLCDVVNVITFRCGAQSFTYSATRTLHTFATSLICPSDAVLHMRKQINTAMQRRLVAADGNLRGILTLAPDLKKMEGMLRKLYRTGQIDIAFNVVLNMNLAQVSHSN
jgi:hypothetical protein